MLIAPDLQGGNEAAAFAAYFAGDPGKAQFFGGRAVTLNDASPGLYLLLARLKAEDKENEREPYVSAVEALKRGIDRFPKDNQLKAAIASLGREAIQFEAWDAAQHAAEIIKAFDPYRGELLASDAYFSQGEEIGSQQSRRWIFDPALLSRAIKARLAAKAALKSQTEVPGKDPRLQEIDLDLMELYFLVRRYAAAKASAESARSLLTSETLPDAQSEFSRGFLPAVYFFIAATDLMLGDKPYQNIVSDLQGELDAYFALYGKAADRLVVTRSSDNRQVFWNFREADRFICADIDMPKREQLQRLSELVQKEVTGDTTDELKECGKRKR